MVNKPINISNKRNFDIDSIKALIKLYKPEIKEASLEFYILGIKRLIEEIDKAIDDNPGRRISSSKVNLSITKLKNTKNVIRVLENGIPSISSRKNVVSSILVFLGSLLVENENKNISKILSEYQDYHKSLAKKKEESYMDNIMTTREKENWITGDDISAKVSELEKQIENFEKESNDVSRTHVEVFQRYLVLNLYTLLPPLRNDYANVKVVENCENFGENEECVDKDYNYINTCSKKLLLCAYKTKKFYGIKKIEIPEKLLEIISKWLILKRRFTSSKECSKNPKDNKNKDSDEFLLINTTTCEKMTTNSLTKFINRIFAPKKISTTMLRKIYLSEKYPVVVSYRDQARDAMVMGHSLAMQKMVYSKKIEK